ncbi:polysaccharide deacetylase [Marivirga tractuosa]|uniref:Polysaccharide deacetylase n=1 Tax=Marivirga tractuosa (strain ATCC 23168 / DSM 4126 / NBRC 15989 / NCIMB 1408 / VKM B-1430 / H-43) TaxID=643867 RepID=E4TQR3_MARTH|nr:polysaccharide deacetylase family protein [Marivirga tractuosa]ADR20624.1 polysaccharide deacetylase [Marivirga tractuosa DSM 4126]BDD14926.1 polysaccharide deacetylase [Marivirga tractuosa]
MSDWAFYKTPNFIQNVFPSLRWRVNTDEKVIYPTFDDGPIPELTHDILNILDDYGAKATFFCVGENIKKHPEIFRSILKKGHTVGNHTFNHLKAWETNNAEYLQNVQLCQAEIEKHIAQKNKLFRFPYGQFNLSLARKLKKVGYELVMWDVLSKDYNKSISAETILRKSVQKSEHGSIIVFHDNLKAKEKILQFLPLYLKHFSDIGYKFEKL